jgi:hypothetical protein
MRVFFIAVYLIAAYCGGCYANDNKTHKETYLSESEILVLNQKFVSRLKESVENNDVNWIASHVEYPFVVVFDKKRLSMKNETEFSNNYSLVFDKVIKKVIFDQKISALKLHGNSVILGSGYVRVSYRREKNEVLISQISH